jgi:hypothetical protein
MGRKKVCFKAGSKKYPVACGRVFYYSSYSLKLKNYFFYCSKEEMSPALKICSLEKINPYFQVRTKAALYRIEKTSSKTF